MERIIIVSNRLPVTVAKRKDDLSFSPSVGGLATGLGSFYNSYKGIWVGWVGISSERFNEKERKIIKTKLIREFSCYPVLLTQKDVDLYYNGFCNKTIWGAPQLSSVETYNQVQSSSQQKYVSEELSSVETCQTI